MQDEIKTMQDRIVRQLIDKPEKEKVLGCRWVYTLKRNESQQVERFKARLVAQGFRQVQGESFDEVYSPVVNFSVIRFFFSVLICLNRWVHVQCDIKGAYLYATLKQRILMAQPLGFKISDKVCLLNKAIYGLHQSGREWFYEIHDVLKGLGFCKFDWCNCVYAYKGNVILLLYVDDIVIFGSSTRWIDKVLNLLKGKFDLKVLGKTKKLLGVEFDECSDKLYIHQRNYINELCKNYEEFGFSLSSLPIPKGVLYTKAQSPQTEQEMKTMQNLPYRSLIGSLSFLATRTRPDIAYAINIFSQYQENPGIAHWNGLLKLLGYVYATRQLKLNISNVNNLNLTAYSDADFGNNRDDRSSMSGQIIFLDRSPIAWRTNKQKAVSLSSMESEFVALTEAAKELIWFKRIVTECSDKIVISQPIGTCRLFGDNQASIDFVKSPIENYRTKHIDVKLFFIRDLIRKGVFEVQYVTSKNNLADSFTKPVSKLQIGQLRDCIF